MLLFQSYYDIGMENIPNLISGDDILSINTQK